MKKYPMLTRLTTVACMATLLIVGCKKENSQTGNLSPQQEQDAATVSTDANTEADFASNDAFDNAMGVDNNVGMAGTGVFGRMSSGTSLATARETGVDSVHCFTVSYVHLNGNEPFPLQVVIDFGAGCIGHDGHTRKGKIIATYTGRLIVPGKSASVTYDGYKIDSLSIQGTHTITNSTTGNQRQFTIDVTDAKITKPSGNYTSWNSHKVLTQVEGNGTPDWPLDDIFTLSGTANGKVQRRNDLFAWRAEIPTSNPLTKKFICPWFVKGVLKVWRETLSSNSQWTASLDFGTGDCDNKASLTINGVTTQITLH
jgi:hypothetical protein